MEANAPERRSVRSRKWESRLSVSERALGKGEMSCTSNQSPWRLDLRWRHGLGSRPRTQRQGPFVHVRAAGKSKMPGDLPVTSLFGKRPVNLAGAPVVSHQIHEKALFPRKDPRIGGFGDAWIQHDHGQAPVFKMNAVGGSFRVMRVFFGGRWLVRLGRESGRWR